MESAVYMESCLSINCTTEAQTGRCRQGHAREKGLQDIGKIGQTAQKALAVCPWANELTSLSLGLLLCRMGMRLTSLTLESCGQHCQGCLPSGGAWVVGEQFTKVHVPLPVRPSREPPLA